MITLALLPGALGLAAIAFERGEAALVFFGFAALLIVHAS